MRRHLLPFALLLLPAAAHAADTPPPAASTSDAPVAIRKALASGDGKTRETAYVIDADNEGDGVAKEYQILRFLGLNPGRQSLMTGSKPYDRIDATDPRTGEAREVWFDISAFFGKL